jgi:hypothetical protein
MYALPQWTSMLLPVTLFEEASGRIVMWYNLVLLQSLRYCYLYLEHLFVTRAAIDIGCTGYKTPRAR